jgi:hypothetical protein
VTVKALAALIENVKGNGPDAPVHVNDTLIAWLVTVACAASGSNKRSHTRCVIRFIPLQ